MPLWVDKHRPKEISQLSHHRDVSSRLSSLASDPRSLPHLLFYGPSGAGKKTRIACLLKAIYGNGAERLRLDKRTFVTSTNRSVDINMICSNYHIEMNPGDAGIYDRYVVQDVIKEMAANKSLNAGGFTGIEQGNGTSASSSSLLLDDGSKRKKVEYKIVVLMEVDKLTRQAQAALRRTMEKYSSSCRLILCCNNQSKVIEPVRSRCLGIRVAAPSIDEICSTLKHISTKEKVTLPDPLAVGIARESSRNLRRAILMLETSRVHSGSNVLRAEEGIQKTDWELYIMNLAKDIIQEQSPQKLMAAREKLYELLVNCIPATIILKTLTTELLKSLDDELKHEVVDAAAFYEHRIAMGSKDIFHLEAFIAKFMSIYKKYLNEMFA
mmetsp:Transcript_193/g.288  ORF Transcript_193/g.288 Transcript_193/m.288 type:complete len:382 (+) Transcript_193:73-1218(+)|eukprot:CAMPEP_0176488292 /NCGR_PEP_ID=MMETSP0200_2-20121128/6625_1 /TAXON_ID=947934 /ORGANISM="Chaetoceros sp., Strain GSL56" /LENGTH=381 /DNA_ID=CAMNT_0017885253 /DNA_START=54 /DNA_END=1199 /DNA_ORIENTATION=-